MKVLAYDPYVSDPYIERFGAQRKPLDELMKQSDYIVVAARVRPDNKGMISKDLLRLMKPSSYLINIARAHLVDYDALYQVLESKSIAGAALDVYPHEPIPEDYPFIGLDNVILSPHLAGSTTDVEKYHSKMIVFDLSLALQGLKPVNLYNPESWERSFFHKTNT
jgi:D-3-phosphoglycerate dehydrogenase